MSPRDGREFGLQQPVLNLCQCARNGRRAATSQPMLHDYFVPCDGGHGRLATMVLGEVVEVGEARPGAGFAPPPPNSDHQHHLAFCVLAILSIRSSCGVTGSTPTPVIDEGVGSPHGKNGTQLSPDPVVSHFDSSTSAQRRVLIFDSRPILILKRNKIKRQCPMQLGCATPLASLPRINSRAGTGIGPEIFHCTGWDRYCATGYTLNPPPPRAQAHSAVLAHPPICVAGNSNHQC